MKMAIVAAAGVSSRFNENESKPVLKGIYTTTDYRKTLLYSILRKCAGFDKVILVGGYQYEALENYIAECRKDFPFQIELVYNPRFQELGTGYTLKVGLEECLKEEKCSEITMVEGDLFFDEASFEKIKASSKNVATYTSEVICSNKAVIAYVNQQKELKYVFSTSHGTVQITEPFWEIYNSGQIWKFADIERVKHLMQEIPQKMWEGTNLNFIEEYFSGIKEKEREMLPIEIWENCNTRIDYLKYAEQL